LERLLRQTTWWLRIVGGFYLLLFAMNVVFIFTDTSVIGDTLPYASTPDVVDAFIDAWGTFILATGAVAVNLLLASRRPHTSGSLILLMITGELMWGVLGDLFLISRGYAAGGYIAFIVVHLIIAGSGVALLRGGLMEARALAPTSASGVPGTA
jgi:hypothetical protein